MYSFLKIGVDIDIEITYHNEIFRIKVTNWKYYKILDKPILKIYHYLMKKNRLKQAFFILKIYHLLPIIKLRNKKYPGEVYEYSIYKSDDMYAKLFDLQKEGLRCRLDLAIPCIQEDILLEFFKEKDID